MSDKIIHLVQHRGKARNLPDYPEGEEVAILTLRRDGGSVWLSEDLTREQLNYLLDLLDRAKDKIRQRTVEIDR